jgi:hypothetical protein
MGIPDPAFAARNQYAFFSVFGYFKVNFSRFGIPGHGPQRYIDDYILALAARAVLLASGLAITGNHMLAVFERQQSPHLGIAPQNDMASPSAISPVRASFWHKLLSPEMDHTITAPARSTVYFYVIDKV